MERTYQLKSTSNVKGKWECEKLSLEMEGDYYDHSWPPKNYNCSFCKREFRSAQALGGHMNVHRRDRARLRQLASPVLQFPNPKVLNRNPNPNPNSSSSSTSFSSRPSFKFIPSPYARKSLVSTPLTAFSSPSSASTNDENKRILECRTWDANTTPPCRDMTKKKIMRAEFGDVELNNHAQKCKLGVFEKEKLISLDLEICLKDPKEVLDLELRLG